MLTEERLLEILREEHLDEDYIAEILLARPWWWEGATEDSIRTIARRHAPDGRHRSCSCSTASAALMDGRRGLA